MVKKRKHDFELSRRNFTLAVTGSIAAVGGGAMAVDYFIGYSEFEDRGETVQESINQVADIPHFAEDGDAYARQLEEGYEAVMRLNPLTRKVLDSDGEPLHNDVAEELEAKGHYLFGEDNELLTNMQPFYDHLGKFNATRREDTQQVTQYTVEVPGLENEVKYTASAEEMRDMEQKKDDGDSLKYELEGETYWKEFVNGLEPVQ